MTPHLLHRGRTTETRRTGVEGLTSDRATTLAHTRHTLPQALVRPTALELSDSPDLVVTMSHIGFYCDHKYSIALGSLRISEVFQFRQLAKVSSHASAL